MAKIIGKITKITNNFFQIDGKGSFNYRGEKEFKEGDIIEFDKNNGNIKNVELYVKVEEKIQEKKFEIQQNNIPNTESKSSPVKENLLDSEIDINNLIKIEKIFTNTEKLENYVKKIDLTDISKAQFSAFENELERVNFNFYSESIKIFTKERKDKRKKAVKFYDSFEKEIFNKIREIESEFGLGDLHQKYKNKFNRQFIEYLKKYYRYKLVLKEEKENSSEGE